MMGFGDRQGNPISPVEWMAIVGVVDRVVAKSVIAGVVVSTVWIGIDHSFGAGPPLIFETMIFDDDGRSDVMDRYSTEAQALAGHEAMCERVRRA